MDMLVQFLKPVITVKASTDGILFENIEHQRALLFGGFGHQGRPNLAAVIVGQANSTSSVSFFLGPL